MSEQTEPRIFQIAEDRIPVLESELAKLNRRADKLGCPHVEYKVHGSKLVPHPAYVKNYMHRCAETNSPVLPEVIMTFPKVNMIEVEIVGEGPKIEGYKFIGTLDHYTLPGEVIVQSVPGEKVPPQFYHSDATCAHCNKIRNRIETFVVENEEDGSYEQVGRNCLRDFFGHDPMAIARFLTRIMSFVDGLDDEDEWRGGGGGRGTIYLDKMEVLKLTTAVIRTFGWVPRSAADNDTATADYVVRLMTPAFSKADSEAKEKLRSQIKFNPEKDAAEAEKAIEWLAEQNQDPDNSYMHNLGLISRADACPIKMIGYWTSLIATYQRAMERLERAKKDMKLNEHYLTEGARLEDVIVKCVGITYSSGFYGPITIHRMLTEAGHTLVWFANSDSKMEAGHRYVIRGRVKKHDEYKGWKQTILTRVNVREDLGEAPVEKVAA